MVTDIGICLGRMMKGKQNELWKLQVQIPMLISFFVGAILGVNAYLTFGKYAIIINLLLFSGTGLLYVLFLSIDKKETLIELIFWHNSPTIRANTASNNRHQDAAASFNEHIALISTNSCAV